MSKLSQVPAQPKSRRAAPSYPRTLMGIGAMMLMAACGGTVDESNSSAEGGSAGTEQVPPQGVAPQPYDSGAGGAVNAGGTGGDVGVAGSSGGGAPMPYGGSGGDQVGGSGGDQVGGSGGGNPAGDIAEPFDGGADSEPPPDGYAPNPYDDGGAGAGASAGAAGAGGALQGEAPNPYEDGGTAGSCNTGGSGGL